ATLSVTTIRSVRQTVAGLSGGQRQSVAVAKAVMWNSKVVILDEPTAALGVAQTRQVLDLVKRLGGQGLAVVLISHNLHDIVQAAAFATIGMGIVFVLLLGEIDLSVGFVSGVAGVLVALLTFPDNHNVFAAGPALVVALLAGIGIGLLHGVIITKLGVPSFVVTLAGLLAWNGAVLLLIGDKGTVIIQNTFFIGFANDFLPSSTAWM